MGNNFSKIGLSFSLKIIFLFSIFLICLYLTAALSALLSNKYGVTFFTLNIQICLQNILTFTFPAVVIAYFTSSRPLHFLGMTTKLKFKNFAFVLLTYLCAIPAMNFIIDWNCNIHLPQQFSQIEQVLRDFEDAAQAMTNTLTSNNSLPRIALLILSIGVLTGFGEEIFFRGMFTNLLIQRPYNKHIAIWIGAFVFSLMHFQFFGFIPRMLLGAFFGYLLVWTDCLWLPIFAHALNNSFAIIVKYIEDQDIISFSVDKVGTTDMMPWSAIISIVIVAFLLSKRRYFGIQTQKIAD